MSNYLFISYGKIISFIRYTKYKIKIKGALDNFSLIPNFFSKKVEFFISLEVYTYVVTAC